MKSGKEQALVCWLEEKDGYRSSIIDLRSVPEGDRSVGCISRVKFGQKDFPAKVLAISRDFEFLEEVDERHHKMMTENVKEDPLTQKRKKKELRPFGSFATDKEVAFATGSKRAPPSAKGAALKQNVSKKAKAARELHRMNEYKEDVKLLGASPLNITALSDHHVKDSSSSVKSVPHQPCSKQIKFIDSSKRGRKRRVTVTSSDEEDDPQAIEDDDVKIDSLNPTLEEDDQDWLKSSDNEQKAEGSGDSSEDELSNNSAASGSILNPSFLAKYQGNPQCISMLQDIAAFLKQAGTTSSSRQSAGQFKDDPLFIEVLPVPDGEAKACLMRGSDVYISKAAKSRIIMEGAHAPKSAEEMIARAGKKASPSTKFDVHIAAKKMTRVALLEMFGKDQLCGATAIGEMKNKKGMRKHVLIALHSFIGRHSANSFPWTMFIDTINRKCEQISRQKKTTPSPFGKSKASTATATNSSQNMAASKPRLSKKSVAKETEGIPCAAGRPETVPSPGTPTSQSIATWGPPSSENTVSSAGTTPSSQTVAVAAETVASAATPSSQSRPAFGFPPTETAPPSAMPNNYFHPSSGYPGYYHDSTYPHNPYNNSNHPVFYPYSNHANTSQHGEYNEYENNFVPPPSLLSL